MHLIKSSKIFVAGHNGMVGSAILRRLQTAGYSNLLVVDRKQLDLTNQASVETFIASCRPDYLVIAAAKVGGIHSNQTYPADFLYENLMIAANLIHTAHRHGIHDLLFLGSSCIYPKLAEQPIVESALLTGALESTNEAYAIAKIAGLKLCASYNRQYATRYRALMPTNLYGPGDNFHDEDSHVIPALMSRFHDAKTSGAERVEVWGSGRARREFLYVDDLAAACVCAMECDDTTFSSCTNGLHVNVGVGVDVTISELVEVIQRVVGYRGQVVFDTTRPDGTPRKLLDVTTMHALGWVHTYDLNEGLKKTYDWFVRNYGAVRR